MNPSNETKEQFVTFNLTCRASASVARPIGRRKRGSARSAAKVGLPLATVLTLRGTRDYVWGKEGPMFNKHLFPLLGIFSMALFVAGCAVPFRGGPNVEEMAAADFGPPPVDYEKIILAWMSDNLKDPFSAVLKDISEPGKSWWGNTGGLAVPRQINYSWLVTAKINGKNSMGAYVGFKVYHFYFRDGKIQYASIEQ